MDDWWSDVERDGLACLDGHRATPVEDVARKLGVSEAAASSLLAQLACAGKVTIRLVEPA